MSCEDESGLCSDQYYGYWGETPWEFEFIDNSKFIFKYNGHYSVGKTAGEYLIRNDTIRVTSVEDSSVIIHGVLNDKYIVDKSGCCIIDLRSKYDYCDGEERGSRFREIEFPQISTNNIKDNLFMDSIFLTIAHELLMGYDSSLAKTYKIPIKPYFELGRTYGDSTILLSKKVVMEYADTSFLTWDKIHIEVNKINWNRGETIFIWAKMYPDPWDNSVLAYFDFENGTYKRYRR